MEGHAKILIHRYIHLSLILFLEGMQCHKALWLEKHKKACSNPTKSF
ncbi:hypothetical protein HAL07_09630 [Helicobacter ailurogastricus]|uniref:Uncharacterized protein n=1 Tax=Helicobacter ailurogastricus TaxID=1578720 RepID=A0A0K2Y0P6_9HELI|nr:hypothetical protein HAL07_09630 [Helicobacter ailurogastricus]